MNRTYHSKVKFFHYNLESFNTNGSKLSSYLKCLNFEYDIICLTEIRTPNSGIISLEFPNYDVYIDYVSLKKVMSLFYLKKINFKMLTKLTWIITSLSIINVAIITK